MSMKKDVDPKSPAVLNWAQAAHAVLQEVKSDSCHMAFTALSGRPVALVVTAGLVRLDERDAFLVAVNESVQKFYADRGVGTTSTLQDMKVEP